MITKNEASIAKQKLGFVFAFSAYFFWGFAPLYFASMDGIGAVEIVIHRTLWSSLSLGVWLTMTGQWHRVWSVFARRRSVLAVVLCGPLIAVNWTIFVWAIEVDRLADASLGYFLNPLMFIVGGVLVFAERLTQVQMAALIIAFVAVSYLTITTGELVWIAPIVATIFTSYAFIRKWAKVPPVAGLFAETVVLLPVALVFLVLGIDFDGIGAEWVFGHTVADSVKLAGVGIVTVIPLIWFNAATQRLEYKYVGFLQFISPSIMFFLAIWILNEPLETAKLHTFIAIWIALALLVVEQLKRQSTT